MQNSEQKACAKCGNIISEEQRFCSYCGKSTLPTQKKAFKKLCITLLICSCVIALIAGASWCGYMYYDKQQRYDVITDPNSHFDDGVNGAYAYEIRDAEGEILTDIYYFEDNYFVNVLCHGDVVYVSQKGVYETNEGRLVLENEKGEKTEYILRSRYTSRYIIEKGHFYEGDVPKQDKIDGFFTKEDADTSAQLSFNENGTYHLKQITGEYTGAYNRNGYIIEGVCEDIIGSHKWLVYDGKLSDRFFIANDTNGSHAARAKYEYYKYLQGVAPDKLGPMDRAWVKEYEEAHPISANKPAQDEDESKENSTTASSTENKMPSGFNENDYISVSVEEVYKNPQKYDGKLVKVAAYNVFYLFQEPTYAENYYDLYLMSYLSGDIDNSQSGLDKNWSKQFDAFYDLKNAKLPHVWARISDSVAENSFSGKCISDKMNLTNNAVSIYGRFSYNPNTEGYVTDPNVYHLDVHAYEIQ